MSFCYVQQLVCYVYSSYCYIKTALYFAEFIILISYSALCYDKKSFCYGKPLVYSVHSSNCYLKTLLYDAKPFISKVYSSCRFVQLSLWYVQSLVCYLHSFFIVMFKRLQVVCNEKFVTFVISKSHNIVSNRQSVMCIFLIVLCK